MEYNALPMAVSTFSFDLPRYGSRGSRKRFSSKLPRNIFEQTLLVTKELLQCFGKILLKMKSVDNVFRLRSSGRSRLAGELTAIS
jgi:hypothetical protein